MRRLFAGLAAIALLALPAAAQEQPDAVGVFVHDGSYFRIDATGDAVVASPTERPNLRHFTATPEDFVRIRDLLRPYRNSGLLCDDPETTISRTAYFHWREAGAETRRPNHVFCYTPAFAAARQGWDQAVRTMRELANAHWTPPAGLETPDRITLTARYWGRVTRQWTVPRGGEASFTDEAGAETTFAVSEADFDRLRDIFRPYEGTRFECQRVITDGPYGDVTWSQEGHEDQQVRWDAGCVTGDAADIFERWDRAVALLNGLRDGG